jgi:hypothetical protein
MSSGAECWGLSGAAVIVPLNALGEGFEERCLLRVPDDFRQPMADRPAAAAGGALEEVFVKPFGVQINFTVFEAFTDGALHGRTPCPDVVKINR